MVVLIDHSDVQRLAHKVLLLLMDTKDGSMKIQQVVSRIQRNSHIPCQTADLRNKLVDFIQVCLRVTLQILVWIFDTQRNSHIPCQTADLRTKLIDFIQECLRLTLEIIFWLFDTFNNNFEVKFISQNI